MPANLFSVADPQSVADQAQIEQNRQLAQALIQRGLTPSQGSMIGPVYVGPSWTQGLANIASAFAGRKMLDTANQQSVSLAQRQAQMLRGMFGGDDAPATPTATPQPPSQPSGDTSQASQTALAEGAQNGSVGPTVENGNRLARLLRTPAQQSAANDTPNATNTDASVMVSNSPSRSGGGSFRLPGMSSNQAMAAYLLNPEKYGEAYLSQFKPAEVVSELRAAGIDPNSAIGRQISQDRLFKGNYIAPTPIKPGGAIQDPRTGAITTTPAAAPEGFQNVQLSDGSWRTIPVTGGTDAVEASRGAVARGDLQGKLTEVVNPDGSKTMVPGSSFLPNGGTPKVGSAPATVNPGRFGSWNAGGNNGSLITSQPPGKVEAQTGLAKDNVAQYKSTRELATNSADRVNTLDHMYALSQSGTSFGLGTTEGMGHRAKLNAALTAAGLPPLGSDANVNAQIMQKFTSILTQQQMKALGGTGTDKQLETVLHGVPTPDMMNKAMATVIPILKANELAIQAKANAQDQWLANNGNDASKLNQFESIWRQNYDPRVFQMLLMNPQEKRAYAATLSSSERRQLSAKVNFAAQNGWIQ